ncbi:hypothetical protein EBU71_16435 [bacterium]|nr:hypothetical protein [Candidatus Elulimicrobium humile]
MDDFLLESKEPWNIYQMSPPKVLIYQLEQLGRYDLLSRMQQYVNPREPLPTETLPGVYHLFCGNPDEMCTTCFSPLNNTLTKLVFAPCGHCFHYECIVEWLSRRECPICRTSVRLTLILPYTPLNRRASEKGSRVSRVSIRRRSALDDPIDPDPESLGLFRKCIRMIMDLEPFITLFDHLLQISLQVQAIFPVPNLVQDDQQFEPIINIISQNNVVFNLIQKHILSRNYQREYYTILLYPLMYLNQDQEQQNRIKQLQEIVRFFKDIMFEFSRRNYPTLTDIFHEIKNTLSTTQLVDEESLEMLYKQLRELLKSIKFISSTLQAQNKTIWREIDDVLHSR